MVACREPLSQVDFTARTTFHPVVRGRRYKQYGRFALGTSREALCQGSMTQVADEKIKSRDVGVAGRHQCARIQQHTTMLRVLSNHAIFLPLLAVGESEKTSLQIELCTMRWGRRHTCHTCVQRTCVQQSSQPR